MISPDTVKTKQNRLPLALKLLVWKLGRPPNLSSLMTPGNSYEDSLARWLSVIVKRQREQKLELSMRKQLCLKCFLHLCF